MSRMFWNSYSRFNATGSNISWYSDVSLSTLVGTGSNLSTGQNSVGVYTYYVTSTDINGCESVSTSATLEIYSLPNSPTANNEVACVVGVIPDLVSSGLNPTWYSDAALTNVVANGTNFSTGQTAAGVYTYYVTETNSNGCESAATSVTLTINAFNTLPIASNVNTCFGSPVPDLTAVGVGTSFTWYSDVNLLMWLVQILHFYRTNCSRIVHYYVTETQNGCQSPATTVTLEIYALPNTGPISHW